MGRNINIGHEKIEGDELQTKH